MTTIILIENLSTRITDSGLVHVGRMQRLKGLYLTRTGITDGGLQHLRDLENLETLEKYEISPGEICGSGALPGGIVAQSFDLLPLTETVK